MEENERDKGGEVEIWSWGAGTDGQLGTTRLEDEHLPQLLDLPRFSSAGPISLLACGGAHVLALTTGLSLSLSLSLSPSPSPSPSLAINFGANVCLYAYLQMERWWHGEEAHLVNWVMGTWLAACNPSMSSCWRALLWLMFLLDGATLALFQVFSFFLSHISTHSPNGFSWSQQHFMKLVPFSNFSCLICLFSSISQMAWKLGLGYFCNDNRVVGGIFLSTSHSFFQISGWIWIFIIFMIFLIEIPCCIVYFYCLDALTIILLALPGLQLCFPWSLITIFRHWVLVHLRGWFIWPAWAWWLQVTLLSSESVILWFKACWSDSMWYAPFTSLVER